MKKALIVQSILAAELVLLIPLFAMQFGDEWDWGLADFILVGILLAVIGFSGQLLVSGLKQSKKHVVVGAVLIMLMILIWIELAVGIFGSEIAGS